MYSHYQLEKISSDRSMGLREESTRERMISEMRREARKTAGSVGAWEPGRAATRYT